MGKTGLQIFYFYWPSFLCDCHLEFWSLSEKGPPQYFGPIIFKSGGGGHASCVTVSCDPMQPPWHCRSAQMLFPILPQQQAKKLAGLVLHRLIGMLYGMSIAAA